MADLIKENKFWAAQQNISYYNEIADVYDDILRQEEKNGIIRQRVKEKFTGILNSGWVLDFGGGTGLDLEWLTAKKYKIIFCEPSTAMREKAVAYNRTSLRNNDIIFLSGERTDFAAWDNTAAFHQQVDGILSNFGVINCISDIQLLFSRLASITRTGGHFVALFLDRSVGQMLQWHRRNALRSLIFGGTFITYVWHKGHQQIVFVHSIKDIKKAASPFFDYAGHECWKDVGFNLIHLVRK